MKPLLKFGLIFICLAIYGEQSNLNGQGISVEETAKILWLEKSGHLWEGNVLQFDRVTGFNGLYVFEKFDPASFIILSGGTDGFLLVGYSFDNLFFAKDSVPARQTALLNALAESVKKDPDKIKGTHLTGDSIGPLIRTKWGQGKFFNYYCPQDSRGPNGRVYAGCVAVAMGQIIRYYGRFNSIQLEHSYESGYYGKLSATIGPYKWKDMEDEPITINLEVSDFLRDLGVMLHMCYGPSGSTSNSHRALEVFHELGYNTGVILRRTQLSIESWTDEFYQNLLEYKPILVTGGGHAFVCDGYNASGLFHFNLGWDGYADGYYPLSGVLTMPVNEAFTGLEPFAWPEPPRSIRSISNPTRGMVAWSYDSDQNPLLSRIYVDDSLFRETADTIFDPGVLVAGIHTVNISAVYPEGESRWIGPIDVFVQGALLNVQDPVLYGILQKSLGHGISDTEVLQIYDGDLSRITSLVIDQPIVSMEGLGLCNHLKRLVIQGFPGPGLDPGPLENLTKLRVLEWNGRIMTHPESLGHLDQLSELRIRQTSTGPLDFLQGFRNLMKFEYSGSPVENPGVLAGIPLLDDLVLKETNLSDGNFIGGIPQLLSLDLSGNNLTETGFLSGLAKLEKVNLSGNQISNLLLTDQLQSLHEINVSDNDIDRVTLTADLKLLHDIDLSGNKLVTPGRLFLYTPALSTLNLSKNEIRDMGKQRCQNLESLNVSYNQLITTDWVSLQPRLKSINLEHNRISDLSGLTRNNLFRQLYFLGLDQNPISKQSFAEWLPLLMAAVDSISIPEKYESLSPCYLTPANGSRVVGPGLELEWYADTLTQSCSFDVFFLKNDSLVPVLVGLDKCKVQLEQIPPGSFTWMVATRTQDSVYYSGFHSLFSTAPLELPFNEGFEPYQVGEPLLLQSDKWFTTGASQDADDQALVVSSVSRTGSNCLQLAECQRAILTTGHLNLPFISIQFSVLIPPGHHGGFQVQNLNGMYIGLVWDASNLGKLYINDKLVNTFPVDHFNWMDFSVMAHARNNNIYIKSGKLTLLNDPWPVPEGVLCMEQIEFYCSPNDVDQPDPENGFFIDDLKISTLSVTSTGDAQLPEGEGLSVFPNPFADIVKVSFRESGPYDLSVTDLTGREVYRKRINAVFNNYYEIRLTGLAPGVYMFHSGKPEIRPKRIIKI